MTELGRAKWVGLGALWMMTLGCGLDSTVELGGESGASDAPDAMAIADAGAADADADADVMSEDGALVDAGQDIGEEDAREGTGGGEDVVEPPVADHEAIYPSGRTLSPLTPSLVEGLQGVVEGAGHRPDVFAKIGDSNTVNTRFMHCFADAGAVSLDRWADLEPTVAFFRGGRAQGTTPFDRESEAAVVGWSAGSVISGAPSALDRELDAIDPRYGLVMFGTNDIQRRDIIGYGEQMWEIADRLLARGVVPIFSTIPRREDDAQADAWVPRYNAVVRAIAQSRQVPLVDLWHAWESAPGYGLGGDGLHLNAHNGGCDFGSEGLEHGQNVRNLHTMRMLDRVRRALESGQAPDPPGPARVGDGGPRDSIVIEGLPFVDSRDTRAGGAQTIDAYSGCAPDVDEGGPEYFYRFVNDRPRRVRAFVVDQGDTDIDVHLLEGAPTGQACVERDHEDLTWDLDAGTYYFSLDTWVGSSGVPRAGEYLFILVEE